MKTWAKTKTNSDKGGPGMADCKCGRQPSTETPAKTVRVLIADDHPVVRKGLTNYLARQPRLDVIGEAADGIETLAKARELIPDLVLMDIDMPKLSGLEAAEILYRENPRVKVLILSGHSAARYALEILKSGAHGSVSKEASTQELLQAIQTVASGGSYFNCDTATAALRHLAAADGQARNSNSMSPRERQVLVALTEGLSSKEIANRLGISLRTVETHRGRIMRKLNIRNVAGLTQFAILQGLIPSPTSP